MKKPAWRWTLLMLLSLSAFPARAGLSIGASPAYLEVDLEKGKTSAQTILLFNSGSDPITVRASAGDWWHEPGNPRKFGPAGTLPHSAAKWLTFSPEQITVSPQKAVNVTVIINTPESAKAGNYAVAWFEAVPEAKKGSKEIRVGAKLGVLVMTAVRGTTAPLITVKNLKINPPTESELMKVSCTLVNSGDVHLLPKGTLVVMNNERKLVGHVGFDRRRLLPGETADVDIKWGDELAPGNYQAILTVDYGESGATVEVSNFVVKPQGSN